MNSMIVRSIYIVSLLFISTFSFGATYSPKNTGVGFDYHGTMVNLIFKKMGAEISRTCDDSSHKAKILLMSPFIIGEGILSCYWKNICDEGRLADKLIKNHSFLNESREHLSNLINPHVLNEDVALVIQELRENKFNLSFTSNIDPYSLSDAQRKYPHVFAAFKSYYIPHNDENTGKKIQKPDPDYFLEWARKAKKDNPELTTLVFIDDKKKNCEGALKANAVLQKENIGVQFETILFTSAAQLREDLKKYTSQNI